MHRAREQFDALAWNAIRRRRAPEGAVPGVGRPANFPAIVEHMRKGSALSGTTSKSFIDAFHDFLDEFYYFKQASFFEQEPPVELSERERAFLAATAEHLSRRFHLPVPDWTQNSEYFLKSPLDMVGATDRRRGNRDYRRHGIIYDARGLIRL